MGKLSDSERKAISERILGLELTKINTSPAELRI